MDLYSLFVPQVRIVAPNCLCIGILLYERLLSHNCFFLEKYSFLEFFFTIASVLFTGLQDLALATMNPQFPILNLQSSI